MTSPIQIGLLPFYLKLYEDLFPASREGFTGFLEEIAAGFRQNGFDVNPAPLCRVRGEFHQAVEAFTRAGVDAVVCVHLAYSPSLEAVDVLCESGLPLILLDTTMDAAFGPEVSADRVMYNHGVHGVMDLASMLRRRGRAFEIVAGHFRDSPVVARAADRVCAAVAARALAGSRLLRVGKVFPGMGDFSVEDRLLAERFGMQVDEISLEVLDEAVSRVTDPEVEAELARDRELYVCDLEAEPHRRSVRVGLGLRKLLEEGGYQGCSVNFQEFERRDRPSCVMPFLEASKAMERGIGYAGEGDVLTAALVGALARSFGGTTFTEIFCPDWSGDSLFLSHMGEISPSVLQGKGRVFEKPLPFMGAHSPAILTGAVRPGPAVLVDLVPGPEERFSLIIAPVEVLPESDKPDPAMRDNIRAWIRPAGGDIAHFLETYSRAGGTHHHALVLGDRVEGLAAFGRGVGMDVVAIS